MGRRFRKLWIGLLSGTAVLAACNVFSPPPCYYGPPPVDPGSNDSIMKTDRNSRREMLRQRIQAINDILEERSNSEIYGSPEMMEEYARENRRLKAEADSLELELKNLEKEQ